MQDVWQGLWQYPWIKCTPSAKSQHIVLRCVHKGIQQPSLASSPQVCAPRVQISVWRQWSIVSIWEQLEVTLCEPSFFCLHANCSKKFKNKGDLTRHVKEHDGVLHECPNCDYKNADIRNLESHQIKHSKIEKYSCKLCEKRFNYNTQLRRYIRDKKCPKLSGSPEH